MKMPCELGFRVRPSSSGGGRGSSMGFCRSTPPIPRGSRCGSSPSLVGYRKISGLMIPMQGDPGHDEANAHNLQRMWDLSQQDETDHDGGRR